MGARERDPLRQSRRRDRCIHGLRGRLHRTSPFSNTRMAQDNVTSIQKSTGAISHRRINLIRAICDENENAVRLLSRIGKDQQAFIISRWKMGRSIDELLDGERGQYGENAVEAIADHTGMHPNTIYECRRFYTTTPDGPERWMESVIAANGIVLWKNVRLLIAQKTDVETLGAQGALERRIYSVDKRIERLEQDMSEIARDARSNGIAPDLKEKVLGVANNFGLGAASDTESGRQFCKK